MVLCRPAFSVVINGGKTMKDIDDKVLDYIGYVFMYYKMQRLLDRGIELKPEEMEKIDKMNANVLGVECKYSCSMM